MRAVLPLLLLVACKYEPQVLDNWNFNFWRDDQLVGWQVIRGAVQQAATWNTHDLGVELLGDDTVITQLTTLGSACMRVDVIADVRAEVAYEVDFGDDGSTDATQQIPVSSWAPVSFTVRGSSAVVRFTLVKRGAGRAVLANMRVQACDP